MTFQLDIEVHIPPPKPNCVINTDKRNKFIICLYYRKHAPPPPTNKLDIYSINLNKRLFSHSNKQEECTPSKPLQLKSC